MTERVPTAWIASHAGGKTMHLSKEEGWQVDAVIFGEIDVTKEDLTIREALNAGMIGGCDCQTKSPEVKLHDKGCKYRLCALALAEIDRVLVLHKVLMAEADKRYDAMVDKLNADYGVSLKTRNGLIGVVRRQHRAIDMLFARLIATHHLADQGRIGEPFGTFYPSASGEPWAAAQEASRLMKELGEEL